MKKRTIVYIDGFNLYYGCLKKSPYKWLDIKKMCSKLLGEDHDIYKIKFFTANLLSRVDNTSSNRASLELQKKYLHALKKHIPELEIYYGRFLNSTIRLKNVNPPPKFVDAHKTEEKGTDVNIGLEILNDAWLNGHDCTVLVSNDSDLSRALELVKKNHKKMVGVIAPKKGRQGFIATGLAEHADFVYSHIRDGLLSDSQLPDEVPNLPFKPYKKPKEWD
jgi:uncharacterized LabA/DUF88 family protein